LEPLFEAHRDSHEPLAAVMLDLDNFKNYNDTHGHQAGDALLRFIGALLRGAIRPSDHAVRYGGDEFLLVLPQANAKQATAIADRVVKLFRQYSSCLQQEQRLSLSAGVAAIPDHPCDTGEELIAKADRALYTAKASGKDAVFVSSSNGHRASAADETPPLLAAG
jgi:diguanylate cyclase (GGDEF)-like protein